MFPSILLLLFSLLSSVLPSSALLIPPPPTIQPPPPTNNVTALPLLNLFLKRQAPATDILVALYARDLKTAQARAAAGYERWHWAIHAVPSDQHLPQADVADPSTTMFHAINPPNSDRSPFFDPKLFVFEQRPVDPRFQYMLLARVQIGQLPDTAAAAAVTRLRSLFSSLPIPNQYIDPSTSCVSWVRDAVRALQRNAIVASFDTAPWMDAMVQYGEARYAQITDTTARSPLDIARIRFETSRYDAQQAEIVPYVEAKIPHICRRAFTRRHCIPQLVVPGGGGGGDSAQEWHDFITDFEAWQDGKLVPAYEAFAKAEFARVLPAYGLSSTRETMQKTKNLNLYSTINGHLRGYERIPSSSKVKFNFRQGFSSGFAAAVMMVPWVSNMITVFNNPNTTEAERLGVTLSIVPGIGCLPKIAADSSAGRGFDATQDTFCLVSGALMLTPAAPLALAAIALKTVIEKLPTMIEEKNLFHQLLNEKKLQERRVAVWTKRQYSLYDRFKIELGRDSVTNGMRQQRRSSALVILYDNAQTAAALHATTLHTAATAAQRNEIRAGGLYHGATQLNVATCARLHDLTERLKADAMTRVHEHMKKLQDDLDNKFWTWAEEFMVRQNPGVQSRFGVGSRTDKQVRDYLKNARHRHLPAPLSDNQTSVMRKIIDAAYDGDNAWAVAPRCRTVCRQSDDLDCFWASCGAPPPTAAQIRDSELLHVASADVEADGKLNLTESGSVSVSESCRASFAAAPCSQSILMTRARGLVAHPSKLLCMSRSGAADVLSRLDPTRERGNDSFLQPPDYQAWLDRLGESERERGQKDKEKDKEKENEKKDMDKDKAEKKKNKGARKGGADHVMLRHLRSFFYSGILRTILNF